MDREWLYEDWNENGMMIISRLDLFFTLFNCFATVIARFITYDCIKTFKIVLVLLFRCWWYLKAASTM